MSNSKFTIRHQSGDGSLPPASISITVHVKYENDAPPALVEAIGKTLAQFIVAMDDEEVMDKVQTWFAEHQARKQREADHVAQQLLGDEEPQP